MRDAWCAVGWNGDSKTIANPILHGATVSNLPPAGSPVVALTPSLPFFNLLSGCTMQYEDEPIPGLDAPDCTVGLNAVGEQLLRQSLRKERRLESLRKARVKKGKKSSRLDRRKGVQKAAKVKRMILPASPPPASPPPASPPQLTAAHRSQKHLLSTERRYKCWLCAKSFKYGAVLELCTHKRIQIDPEQGFCVPCVRAKRLNRLCPVGCQVAAQWV